MSGWVRLWEDMPTDPKWRVIARKSGQSIGSVIAVFTMLMVEAGKAGRKGDVSGARVEDIGAALDIDDEAIVSIIDAMRGRVIEGDALSGWEKRQPKRDDASAERVRAHRERKSGAMKRDETRYIDTVTQCNAPEAEAEAEAEAASAASAGVAEKNGLPNLDQAGKDLLPPKPLTMAVESSAAQDRSSAGIDVPGFNPRSVAVDAQAAQARSRAELEALEAKLRSAAGLENDPSPSLFVVGPIVGLLDSGADLEADILPVIRARARTGAKPRSWLYFVSAIQDAMKARHAAGGAAPKRHEPENETPAEKRKRLGMPEPGTRDPGWWKPKVEAFFRCREWVEWMCGPPPGEPGCLAPQEWIDLYRPKPRIVA